MERVDLTDDEKAELERLEQSLQAPPGSNLRGPKLPAKRRRSKTRRNRSRARRKARATG